ncbi:MAG: hypothetical protein KJO72_11070 [Gammaproteobacteria bacterium]|nr:hypothetical protein [Gammaproteobacteria bacterium]
MQETNRHFFKFSQALVTCVLFLAMALLVGCGGTKVYNIDKTMTYRDTLYNVSSVSTFKPREEARLADGEVVSLRGKEKKALQAFFKENPGVMVSMIVDLDTQELVYLRSRANNYSEYSRMKNRFDGAVKDITKFMGNKKSTQLKLK